LKPQNKKTFFLNILFIGFCASVFLFLWNAPEETTSKLPDDEDHIRFKTMDKKEAEKFCNECHSLEGDLPLPADHPPKYRCLFCHKQK
jgi:hypothetical protein